MSVRPVAAGGFSGLLLTLITVYATASASPAPSHDPLPDTDTRPCFLEPMHWNAALDGPVPRCPTWAAAHPAPTIVLRRDLPVP
jgi:hypothetical protein